MKKTMAGILAAVLFLGVAGPAAAKGRTIHSLNVGILLNTWMRQSFGNPWFTLDFRLAFPLGRSFEISPEVMFAVNDSFDFSNGSIDPGIMLNARSGGFFIGGGAVLPVFYGGGEKGPFGISPKINVGYDLGKIKLTAYMIALNDSDLALFTMNQAGISVGVKF